MWICHNVTYCKLLLTLYDSELEVFSIIEKFLCWNGSKFCYET